MDRTRRSALLLAAGLLFAAPIPGRTQRPERIWRVGFLTNGTVKTTQGMLDAFVGGLKDLGYIEGKNLVIEPRHAEGQIDRLPALVADLLRQRPDVVFAPSGIAAQAVKDSGTPIPIVFAFPPDPVGQGFAASLARPGGRMTGLTSTHDELSAKRMALLKELLPRMKRVGVLYFSPGPASGVAEQLAESERAAELLGLALIKEESRRVDDFPRAFSSLEKQRLDGLIVIENPLFYTSRARLAEIAAQRRLPAIYNVAEYVHAGGLMSYGVSYPDLARRAASYVARILKGQQPGELPIERPARFELAINLNAARAIGLTIPPAVLVRADVTVG